ncbi:MAG: alkaline shock response membrane anchor protein AmaP [Schwartzia sp. (in: firmicutes)]
MLGYVNRFLLFLYALAIALASLGLAALWFHLLPQAVIENELAFLLSRWETLAGAAVAFLWSIHFMGCSISSDKASADTEAVVLKGAGGEVRVAVAAVRDMVEKSALMIDGVLNAKARVSARRRGDDSVVDIALRVAVADKENVAALSDSLRAEVRQRVSGTLGINDFSLDVAVTELRAAAKMQKRVN